MRYTHHFKIIRKRRHALPISLIVLGIILILIFVFGFSQVDAKQFLTGFILSFLRVIIAYSISLIIALVISLTITQNKNLEDIGLPILDVLQSFPSFSILPLLLAIFGKSDLVAIIILTLAMIWPILFSILSGVKSENEEVLEAATIFGAKGLNRIIFVILPLIFPFIVTGSIVAWGEAWETVLAAEIIIKIPGVGNYLSGEGQAGRSDILIIGILLLMAILFILNKFLWIPLLNRSTKYQQ